MDFLAKISGFIRVWAWLPKTCLVALLILWAPQVYVPIIAQAKEESTWNREDEAFSSAYLQNLALIMGRNAEKAGTAYGPREYFKDLTWHEGCRIWLNKQRGSHVELSTGGILFAHSIFDSNMRSGIYSLDELFKESSAYEAWSNKNDPQKIADGKKTRADFHRELYGWLTTLYGRGFLLVLLLYAVRMHERRGIVRVILSDKKKFVLAVVLWPIFVTRYPFNLIREIVIEAELRRMGDAFRKMTGTEKLFIQSLAGSREYGSWLKEYRIRNCGSFQRTLLVALVIVLILHCFLPSLSVAMALEDEVRAGPSISVELRQADCIWNYDASACIPTETFTFVFSRLVKAFRYPITEKEWGRIFEDKIDHVPLYGCSALS